MRFHLGIAVLTVLAACGGDSPSAPQEPTYPAVAGTFAVSGGFDGLTSQQANFSGTVTFAQASRESPNLTGTFNVTANVSGSVFLVAAPVQAATVTAAGVLSFAVADASGQWSFSGTMSGTTASGRHTLTDGTDAFAGNWSMQRTSNLVAARVAPAAVPDRSGLTAALKEEASH